MEWVTIKAKNKKDLKIIVDMAKHLKAGVYQQESPYDPEFVAKILESKKQAREGRVTAIKAEDLWK